MKPLEHRPARSRPLSTKRFASYAAAKLHHLGATALASGVGIGVFASVMETMNNGFDAETVVSMMAVSTALGLAFGAVFGVAEALSRASRFPHKKRSVAEPATATKDSELRFLGRVTASQPIVAPTGEPCVAYSMVVCTTGRYGAIVAEHQDMADLHLDTKAGTIGIAAESAFHMILPAGRGKHYYGAEAQGMAARVGVTLQENESIRLLILREGEALSVAGQLLTATQGQHGQYRTSSVAVLGPEENGDVELVGVLTKQELAQLPSRGPTTKSSKVELEELAARRPKARVDVSAEAEVLEQSVPAQDAARRRVEG